MSAPGFQRMAQGAWPFALPWSPPWFGTPCPFREAESSKCRLKCLTSVFAFSSRASHRPCINAWFGVLCCPRSHPRLATDGSACTLAGADDAAPSDGSTLSVLNSGVGTARRRSLLTGDSCANGNVTGTAADYATCEIVGLVLPNNNMAGPVPSSLLTDLPFLRRLVLANNSLSGALPNTPHYTSMSVVDFSSNELEYPPPNALLGACLFGVSCSGYPPNSCDAFGIDYVVQVDAPDSCTRCGGAWRSIAALVAVFVIFLVALGSYAWMVHHHQGFTTQGMASASIIMVHMQVRAYRHLHVLLPSCSPPCSTSSPNPSLFLTSPLPLTSSPLTPLTS